MGGEEATGVQPVSVWQEVCLHGNIKEKRLKGISLEITPFQSTRTKRISFQPHTLPHIALHQDIHVHPGALQRCREELFPVFPPKWKELSTIMAF